MRAFIFSVAILAAACGGKKSGGSTPQAGGTCETAASNIATAVPDLDDAGMTAVANGITEACVQDAWSAGAIGCFANAATADAMQPCGDKLTEAQQQGLTARMEVAPEEEDPMADEPEEPAMDDSELEE